jgi:hypothetical protein
VGQVRFDFEANEPGKTPSGWMLTTPGFEAIVTSDSARQGRQSVRIRSAGKTPGDHVAVLLRSVDATSFRGRTIRLRGALRIEPKEHPGQVQLWLRVDREGNRPGFFDNMDDRPVRQRDWSEAEIVGDVAADAKTIVYGLLLHGDGPAWLDDVRLDITDKVPAMAKESPRALTDRGRENLAAFARLLGYVRHFHPSDEANQTDWEAVAVAGVRAIEPATSTSDLAHRLEEFFRPLGPTIRVFTKDREPGKDNPPHKPDAATAIVAWEHHGYGGGSVAGQMPIYRSIRQRWTLENGRKSVDAPDPLAPFRAQLGAGVDCLVPLALFADEKGTLPRARGVGVKRSERVRSSSSRYSADDRATRLADVILAWNVLQQFYPYFDVQKTDWSSVLEKTLRTAATDQDSEQFLATLRRMIAALKDGHGRVSMMGGGGDPGGCPPLGWDWI